MNVLMDATTFCDDLDGSLNATAIHGFGCTPPGFIVFACWKQQQRVTMGCPVLSQCLQGNEWQGDLAILMAFTTPDMNPWIGGIDITDGQVQGFAES